MDIAPGNYSLEQQTVLGYKKLIHGLSTLIQQLALSKILNIVKLFVIIGLHVTIYK